MNNTISYQDQKTKEDDDEEEALSLSDFPLNSDESEIHRTSSPQPSDSFEFSSDLNSENISHADDIISCGKLVPYKHQRLFDDRILKSAPPDHYDTFKFSRRYCDSLPTRSNARLMRSSRSLDCEKLRRNSSLVMKSEGSDIQRSFSKGSVKSEGFKGLKPRWSYLMFGIAKLPSEMDLRDMKSRQVRRNKAAVGGGAPANRRSSWGHDLLKVLSCRDQPSVAVTASIGLPASAKI